MTSLTIDEGIWAPRRNEGGLWAALPDRAILDEIMLTAHDWARTNIQSTIHFSEAPEYRIERESPTVTLRLRSAILSDEDPNLSTLGRARASSDRHHRGPSKKKDRSVLASYLLPSTPNEIDIEANEIHTVHTHRAPGPTNDGGWTETVETVLNQAYEEFDIFYKSLVDRASHGTGSRGKNRSKGSHSQNNHHEQETSREGTAFQVNNEDPCMAIDATWSATVTGRSSTSLGELGMNVVLAFGPY